MILVTGATGKVGRHLVTELLGAGVPVRALTRGSADPGLPDDAEIARWDPGQPANPLPGSPGRGLAGRSQPFPGNTGTARQETDRPPTCKMCGPLLTVSSCRAYTAGLG
jgi:NAD dependent epimerase/dehydratase family